jgi:hypothetical protein
MKLFMTLSASDGTNVSTMFVCLFCSFISCRDLVEYHGKVIVMMSRKGHETNCFAFTLNYLDII